MEKGNTQRGAQTRTLILDAAEQIFAEHDFSAARLEDVAQAVGIRRASIVYYFPSKLALYDAVGERIYSAMMAHIRVQMDKDTPALERLLGLLDGWLDFLVQRPTVPRLILRDSANSYADTASPVRNSKVVLQAWEAVIVEGQASGEFAPASPVHLLHLLSAGIIYYAATGQLLGDERNYDPADARQLEGFRFLMHRSARALLLPE